MPGLTTVAKKEFLDHISSRKFLLIFGTLLIVVLVSALQGAQTQQGEGAPPTFLSLSQTLTLLRQMVTNISLVGGILAIALSFDAINREKTIGSLKILLSYPIHRDAVINGKFLGGLAVMVLVAITTFMVGIGAFVGVTGIPITVDSALRLITFLGMSIVYLTLFLGIGLLLSIMLSEPSTSLLGSVIVWLTSTSLLPNIGWAIASSVYPPRLTEFSEASGQKFSTFGPPPEFDQLNSIISGISPSYSFETAANSILQTSKLEFGGFGPPVEVTISLEQALMTALPYIVYLIAILVTIFSVCYVRFMREEIR